MPGDTLGCQIKKLGIAELRHSTCGWFPRKMNHEKHPVRRRKVEGESREIDCEAQIWGRREEKGEETAVLKRNC